MSNRTPGPWRYEPGGGHASNRIVGSDIVQVHGWPERRNGVSNASYSERICENVGDISLPGPRANVQLITAAPLMLAALEHAKAWMLVASCDAPSGLFTKVTQAIEAATQLDSGSEAG